MRVLYVPEFYGSPREMELSEALVQEIECDGNNPADASSVRRMAEQVANLAALMVEAGLLPFDKVADAMGARHIRTIEAPESRTSGPNR